MKMRKKENENTIQIITEKFGHMWLNYFDIVLTIFLMFFCFYRTKFCTITIEMYDHNFSVCCSNVSSMTITLKYLEANDLYINILLMLFEQR